MLTIWISIHITTTCQCTFPLFISGIPVIRGQYTDCNLDMTENVLRGGGEGMDGGENNGVLIPQEGNSCQMPPLSNKCSACQECVPTSKSTEQRQERVTCQHTDPEMETGEVKKRGRGEVSLGGLQTVYINSM